MRRILVVFCCLIILLTLSNSIHFLKDKAKHNQRSCLINSKESNSCLNGKIFQNFSVGYKEAINQYATSSFPPEKMQPFMLIVPENIQDIRKTLKFAKHMGKKVVVRSGGHQYSGLSLGGQDTISISMDHFNDLKLTGRNRVEIGPAVALKDAAAFLRDNKLSLPHGECPLVNFGGHAQTGGYGHYLHSFGITSDYVTAFDIILSNGEHKTIRRPDLNANNLTQQKLQDLKLFRGVLGGNAGSFGIITKYYFETIKDEDHPNSWGFTKGRLYSKEKMTLCLQLFQDWSRKITNRNESSIEGLNIQLTVHANYNMTSKSKQSYILFQGLYTDPDGKTSYNNQFGEVLQKFLENQLQKQQKANNMPSHILGSYPLSFMAENFVRKQPSITKSGREYDLPYKKRGSVTFGVLTDDFIRELVDITSQLQDPNDKSIVVSMQMLAAGDVYRKNGQKNIDGISLNSIPFRNLTICFSYDVFYNTAFDENAEQKAIQYQKRLQKIIDDHFKSNGQEKVFFWTSFGDVDMTKEEVILKYYDSIQSYRQMQQLKKKVDPQNLFHSPMTVKLPS